jgi:hypothetical protein
MLRKYECAALDIHAFFELLEAVCVKIFKPKIQTEDDDTIVSECLELFLGEAIPFYE